MDRRDFNAGWVFSKEGSEDSTIVTLPHDAMLHELRNPKCPNGSNTAWFPGGKYTYTKDFYVPQEDQDRFLALEFEGVYRNAEIWVNDKHIQSHAFGYTGFYVPLENLHYGAQNIIRILVDNSQEPNSRWYSGSGIYREVRLLATGKTHIDLDGIKIHTVSIHPPVIEINTSANGGDIHVDILKQDHTIVASGIGNSLQLEIPDAMLWSAETSYLYSAHVTLKKDGSTMDEETVLFGIRKIEWSAEKGLSINGKPTKLRGACIHHDNGILGACAFKAAERRKVRLLKQAGFNAIRSAHNPCSKAMLDACDEYGLYVMDETFDQWFIPKNKYDYARDFQECHLRDLEAMIHKDYNHPSVILYSIGNEVSETQQPRGIELTRSMTEYVKSLDVSRPVTCGINLFLNGLVSKGLGIYREDGENIAEKAASGDLGNKKKLAGSAFFNFLMEHMGVIKNFVSKAGVADKATREAFAHLDICGYNYGTARYAIDGKKYPKRIIIGSETFIPDLYDNWKAVEKYPYLIGDFMWAGWDYLGEAGLGAWSYGSRGGGYFSPYPSLLANSGIIDITGLLTPEGYYAQVALGVNSDPKIGVRPVNHAGEKVFKSPWRNTDAIESWSWSGCEGNVAQVEVYTDQSWVRLLLNGREVGKGKPKKGIARFSVPFEPGILVAEAVDVKHQKVGECSLITAGETTLLSVLPEVNAIEANEQSLVYLDIRITDDKGIVKVLEDCSVSLSIEGPGTLQGFGSANPRTEETFLLGAHSTYYGRAQAVIRSNGKAGIIRVTAMAEGLEPALAEIQVNEQK